MMPDAFDEYCSLFHQDIFEEYGSLENATAGNVADLRLENLKALQVYLETILVREDISLKSLLRKTISDIWFGNAKSARYFLEQTLQATRDRLHKIRDDKIKLYSRE